MKNNNQEKAKYQSAIAPNVTHRYLQGFVSGIELIYESNPTQIRRLIIADQGILAKLTQ